MLIESALVAFGATLAGAVTSLEVQGSQFINPTTQTAFQIVGMAYQIGGSAGYDPSNNKDPLSDGEVCKRDAALMQVLGVNAIRVYNLDPNLNHDECASVFNAAGMYMIIDVNSPLSGESLNSAAPWESYYDTYLNRTFAIVEAFKSYPNTLGFFAGNEVIDSVKTGATVPPYVRAVTRDLKNYIKKNSDRSIPVGYSAADVRSVLEDSWNYFACSIEGEEDDMSRADMFALNSYSWCGDSSFTESGYDQLVAMFEGTSVPIFYSEFGCNTPSPRVFTEIPVIYGDQMTPVFSGGVVYEYAQEANNYGLADIANEGNQSVTLRSDFATLQEQYAKLDWTSIQSAAISTSNVTIPTCSKSLISGDGFNNNFTLPALPSGVQDIIDNGVSPKPTGKIISISDYSVQYTITDASGSTLEVSVKPLADDATNTPGSNDATTGNSTGTSTGSSSTASASSPAVRTVGGVVRSNV
ncbi:beta-glucanosyltransferase gel2 [Pseudomassariella vexata]|uniref:1,3-beta-glucanosyltransferase n=1 Tax=Pseudomassariella vexata TaxID=1141098 RepID=A0A1Y2DCI8_9PEZI|nr:beta-glucanosyltransferase gel2 [Pseudomassariella vexata]ORY56979.1 beta-glucanosyltransferase gel2 [Pseudomassariella vexata]